jgi:hypothetical protein
MSIISVDTLSLYEFDFDTDQENGPESDNISSLDNISINSIMFRKNSFSEQRSEDENVKRQKIDRSFKNEELSDEIQILMELPGILINLLNSGNLEELDKTIHTFFTESCTFQVSHINAVKQGNDKIIEFLREASVSSPDLIFVLQKVKFDKNENIIVARAVGSGSKNFKEIKSKFDNMDKSCGPVSDDFKEKLLSSEKRFLEKPETGDIVDSRVEIISKSTWLMKLNEERDQIDQFVLSYRLLEII